MADETPEAVTDNFAFANDGRIDTLYGRELASQLVFSRVPFRATYEIEHQTTFYIPTDFVEHSLEMLSFIRRTKLR